MKTKIFSAGLFMLVIIHIKAQVPAWQWAKSVGGTIFDVGISICTDVNGNVFVAGSFTSPTIIVGGTTLTSPNTNGLPNDLDFFIAKYDAAGNALWAKKISYASWNCDVDVCTDAAGNVFVEGCGNMPVGNTTLYGYFIAKYDPSGNLLWAKYPATGIFDISDIACDASGNLVVTGSFSSLTMAVGNTTLTNSDSSGYKNDFFIAKYDASGNALWAKSGGGKDYDHSVGISTDTMGNVFVAGVFSSQSITLGNTTFTNVAYSGNSMDIFVVKYDTSGNVLWAKWAGGNSDDEATSICSDRAGGVFISGQFGSSMVFGATILAPLSASNIFIARYDASGNVLWARSGGGTGLNKVTGIITDTFGSAFMTGVFNSSTLTFGNSVLTYSGQNPNTGFDNNIFVAEYDSSGNAAWAQSINALGYSRSIGSGTNGDVFVTGSFNGPTITFGNTVLTNLSIYGSPADPNPSNIFIAKLHNNTTGIKKETTSETLKIFPNPFSTQLVLQSAVLLNNATLTLDNAMGQTVMKIQDISGFEITVLCKQLPAGVYIFHVWQQNKIIATKKLIVSG